MSYIKRLLGYADEAPARRTAFALPVDMNATPRPEPRASRLVGPSLRKLSEESAAAIDVFAKTQDILERERTRIEFELASTIHALEAERARLKVLSENMIEPLQRELAAGLDLDAE